MDDDIPPLIPPTDLPPIRTQEDLHRVWRMLMGPLGFRDRCLWLLLIDEDGHPARSPVQIEELPPLPGLEVREQLARFLGELAAHFGDGTIALLLTRPGRTGLTAGDRRWAQVLVDAVRRAGLRPWPVHRANDHELVVVAPDDLAATA